MLCLYCRHCWGATDCGELDQEKAFLPSDVLQSMAKTKQKTNKKKEERTVATIPTNYSLQLSGALLKNLCSTQTAQDLQIPVTVTGSYLLFCMSRNSSA